MDDAQLLAQGDDGFWRKFFFLHTILGFCLYGTEEQNTVFSGQTSNKFIPALKMIRARHLEACQHIRQLGSQDTLTNLNEEFSSLETAIRSNDHAGILREAQPLVDKAINWKREKIDAEPVVNEKLANYLIIIDWMDLLTAKVGIAYLELKRL